MKDIYDVLKSLEIDYIKHDHPPVFTCEEAAKYHDVMKGAHIKNIFLRNRNANKHYLVVIPEEKRLDLDLLKGNLGESKLGFASPERLMKYLGLTPGSVSILGLVNNEEKNVIVIIDNELWKTDAICCHPNVNTATLEIKRDDLKKFLDWCGNEVRFMDL
ncbi:prolyl-tRNA synthetase associated domain-containing protein [Patescibacteria group bacterium]|nr:prolyl-tRNA synthetase associated domain-containing protein [Patescibacteria group bacterium]